jgi:hypothetical protein
MEKNFRMVNEISRRPLEFSVVNAGNILDFLVELSANGAMMNDLGGYDSDRYLETFCGQYFGRGNATAVAALYRRFYEGYWPHRNPACPTSSGNTYSRTSGTPARSSRSCPNRRSCATSIASIRRARRGGGWALLPDGACRQRCSNSDRGRAEWDGAAIDRLTGVVQRADASLPTTPEQGRAC